MSLESIFINADRRVASKLPDQWGSHPIQCWTCPGHPRNSFGHRAYVKRQRFIQKVCDLPATTSAVLCEQERNYGPLLADVLFGCLWRPVIISAVLPDQEGNYGASPVIVLCRCLWRSAAIFLVLCDQESVTTCCCFHGPSWTWKELWAFAGWRFFQVSVTTCCYFRGP